MTEYIDKSLLRQKMYHEAFETDTDLQRWDSGCWIRYKLFENCLDDIPAADVRPVVRGHWEAYTLTTVKCSVCGAIGYDWKRFGNFCQNCGADMREADA